MALHSTAFLTMPSYSLFLSVRNHAPWHRRELHMLVAISCIGWVTNHFTARAHAYGTIHAAVGPLQTCKCSSSSRSRARTDSSRTARRSQVRCASCRPGIRTAACPFAAAPGLSARNVDGVRRRVGRGSVRQAQAAAQLESIGTAVARTRPSSWTSTGASSTPCAASS